MMLEELCMIPHYYYAVDGQAVDERIDGIESYSFYRVA